MSTKRLIETAFPLAEASAASLHEKNMRHGHISTLHLWPARRPLAASRAAIAAALLPDPGNDDERTRLIRRLGGRLVPKKKSRNEEGALIETNKVVGDGGILWWGHEGSPDVGWFRDEIRKAHGGRAPKVLDPFAGGGALPLEAMRLGCDVTASDLNPVAWFLLKCTLEYPQKLSGQRRPLPDFVLRDRSFMEAFLKAQGIKPGPRMKAAIDRSGGTSDAFDRLFSDDDQPWMDASLDWHIRAWGQWVLSRVRQKIVQRYPTYAEWTTLSDKLKAEQRPLLLLPPGPDGRVTVDNLNYGIQHLNSPLTPRWVSKPTVAYLWARTVRCKSCRATIPLLKTRWLCRKDNKRIRLSMEANARNDGVVFNVETNVPIHVGTAASRAAADKSLAGGNMSRTGAKCACCPNSMTMDDIRYEAQSGRIGETMTAVVCDGPQGKEYRDPTSAERKAAIIPASELDELFSGLPFGRPSEPISPERPSPNTRGASGLTRYGVCDWGKLFTDRQLLVLGHLCGEIRHVSAILAAEGYPEVWQKAIASYLALANDRVADYGSILCSWANSGEFVRGTFVRFVLSLIWDYTEVNPLSEVTGGYLSALEWIAKAVAHTCDALKDSPQPRILLRSATEIDGEYDAVVTDPPYYDAIPYSDLMDFFHVWLRRALYGLDADHDQAFGATTGPKWDAEKGDGELVDQPGRFKADGEASRTAYEEGMARVFKACQTSLNSDGTMILVFANKQPLAWGALVASLIRSGFMVDASWPIKTERGARTNAISTASLSSSVWLVCRKRSASARPSFSGKVLEQMRENIHGQMQRFWDAGIRGPDFVWAATGPALEAYSQYPVVFRETSVSGEKERMPIGEFLFEVRRLVVEFAVGRVLRKPERGEETDGGHLDDLTTYYILHRDTFGMAEAPIGACILYALSCGIPDHDLTDRFDILVKSGGKVPTQESDDVVDETVVDDQDGEDEVSTTPTGSGSSVRLQRWDQRKKKSLGLEGTGHSPAPLIDRVHRAMQLWKEGDVTKVNAFLSRASLARDPIFSQLLQALIELAHRDGRQEEAATLESLSNHLQSRSGVSAAPQAILSL